MGFSLRNILDPSQNPLVPKPLQKLYGKTVGGKLQHMTDNYVAPKWKDPSRQSYTNPFTGEEVKYKKGGKVRGDGCCVKGKTKGRFR